MAERHTKERTTEGSTETTNSKRAYTSLAAHIADNPDLVIEAAELFDEFLGYMENTQQLSGDCDEAIRRVLDRVLEDRNPTPEWNPHGEAKIAEKNIVKSFRQKKGLFADMLALTWATYQLIGDHALNNDRHHRVCELIYWLSQEFS